MRLSWELKPNLMDCILEDRIVPASMNNLGLIVQTTGGLALVTPFPGAINLASLAGAGAVSAAASVSGTAMPTSFYMTSRGISSFSPGNMTGNPAVAGLLLDVEGGAGGVIRVGSGADEAGGPSSNAASSRTNPATNGQMPGIMAYIGQVASASGNSASDSAASDATKSQTAPVPSLPPPGNVIPGSPNGNSPASPSPMSPSFGAPRLIKGLGSSLTPTLPGGLGVGSLTSPSMSGGY